MQILNDLLTGEKMGSSIGIMHQISSKEYYTIVGFESFGNEVALTPVVFEKIEFHQGKALRFYSGVFLLLLYLVLRCLRQMSFSSFLASTNGNVLESVMTAMHRFSVNGYYHFLPIFRAQLCCPLCEHATLSL